MKDLKPDQKNLISDLNTLNLIAQTLNSAVDVKSALNSSLRQLVQLMGLTTGWIFVHAPGAIESWAGYGFQLAAHYQLPPAMGVTKNEAWNKSCSCQNLCKKGRLDKAYNEVRCSRLAEAHGNKNGLTVHASTPLKSGTQVLGILNVAAKDWASFDERSLALLTTVGTQIGPALERARLHDLLREQRIQEQSALLTFSQELLRGSSLSSLESFIVDEARSLLNVDACALFLSSRDDKDQLYFMAAAGWRTDPVGLERKIPGDQRTRVGQVMVSKRSLVGEIQGELPQSSFERWATAEDFKTIGAVPMIVDDTSIGVLAIHSRSERDFNENDLRFLQLLANQAAIALESARLQMEQVKRQQLEKEMAVGRQIQKSMLPVESPIIPNWQFATAIEAANAVGGDFYDFSPFAGDSGKWGVVIADVSDKGVPAALYMVLSRTTIRNAAQADRMPAHVLRLTNQYIHEDSQADMFLSVFYAILDTNNGRLTYSNAGHNPPLLWRRDSETLVELREHGTLVGVLDDLHLENHVVDLEEGDVLFLYTDGVTDAINSCEEDFGMDRLREVVASTLRNNHLAGAPELVDNVLEAVDSHKGEYLQFDDVTLFVIKRVGSS